MENTELTQSEVEDLAARHPLPEGVPDAVLNREELAEALDTSLPTITAWIGLGMPVQQTGGQGKPYELKLSHCFAWRQAMKANEDLRNKQARDSIRAMRLQLVGGKSGDSIEALDPKQRREILSAQIEHERLLTQRKQHMPRETVRDMLDNMLMLVRDVMEAAPDRVERIEAMPPKAIDAFVDVCDGLVAELERRVVSFWDLHREARTQAKRDLFDA